MILTQERSRKLHCNSTSFLPTYCGSKYEIRNVNICKHINHVTYVESIFREGENFQQQEMKKMKKNIEISSFME